MTDKGELIIKSAEANVEITVKRNGKPVDDLVLKKGDNAYSVYSGEIEVVLRGTNADSFVVRNNTVTLKRGDDWVVEIERKGLAANAATARLCIVFMGRLQPPEREPRSRFPAGGWQCRASGGALRARAARPRRRAQGGSAR